MKPESDDWLVWIDLETSGLNPETCKILEIGVIITTRRLEEVGRASWLTDCPGVWENGALRIHGETGFLLEWLESDRVEIGTALRELREFLLEHGVDRSPLCGSTPSFDRGFLRRHAPADLMRHFTHRHIDASTISELLKYADPPPALGPVAHRALADLEHSIAVVKHAYRLWGLT